MEHAQYVIFDMDGTLLDSMGQWLGLIDEALSLLPEDVVLPAEARAKIQTMGIRRAHAYLASLNVADSGMFTEEGTEALMRTHYENDVALTFF